MRNVIATLICAACLVAVSSQASEATSLKKSKTGILPAGGFYSLYEASCDDQRTVSLASLERRGRWCSEYQGELNCFRQSKQALQAACVSRELAKTEEEVDIEA